MATYVQRCWRGWFSRRYIHDFYARKEYINQTLQTNNAVRQMLQEFEREAVQFQEDEGQRVETEKLQTEILRAHHMLSTESIQGILSSTRKANISESQTRHLTEESIRSNIKTATAKVQFSL